MIVKKVVLAFFVFHFCLSVTGQKLELGKVTLAELEEKEHLKDPSAPAAILFKKGTVRFEYLQDEGFVIISTIKSKIKVYKKEGYDWANFTIPYYLGSNYKESVSLSDVATYNVVDGKVVKTKLKSDGEFDEKVNKYWGQKKITMPNVKEGSIIEYEYTIKSPSIGSLKEWDFQSSIPVNYSEYKTYIPQYYVYNPNQKGTIFPKVTVEKSQRTITMTNRERSGGRVVSSTIHNDKFDFEETQTTYTALDLPAIKEEAFVNNMDNYVSSISNELSIVNYPNEPVKYYSTDWDAVTKKIYQYDDFGPELNKTGYFENDITTLVAPLLTQEEKIAAIFTYVKSNIKWDGYNDYYCHDGVRQAFKNKTGNVAEINLMLTAMLRFAGIDANPVLISTRANGIAFFPNRTAFNYVIAAVEIQNGLVLLDATEKYATPNVLPLRDINWMGRLIRKEGSSTEVNLIPTAISKEINYMNLTLNNGLIEGKYRRQLTDHRALAFRQNKIGIAKDAYLEDIENKNNSIEINEYSRENETDLSKPIVEAYSFKDTKDLEIINDKIYLAPLLFLNEKTNPFKLEKREYPIDFGFPFQYKYNVNVVIPEGYSIESIPKPLNMVTGDDIGSFKYNIGTSEIGIQITVTFEINAPIVGSEFYEVVKEFYQKMIDKENEKIVFIKK